MSDGLGLGRPQVGWPPSPGAAHLITLVHQDEEEVEAGHDGGGHVDVLHQGL